MHKDASGRAINKGDFVAYSGGTGRRSAGLRFGYVFELKEKVIERDVYNQTTKAYDNVTETYYRIQVVAADHRFQYSQTPGQPGTHQWTLYGKDFQGNGKSRLNSVEMLERVIVIEPHQIPPEARKLLEEDKLQRGVL